MVISLNCQFYVRIYNINNPRVINNNSSGINEEYYFKIQKPFRSFSKGFLN